MKGIETSCYSDEREQVIVCPHITIIGLVECEEGVGDQQSKPIKIHCSICDKDYLYSFEEYY